MARIGQAQFALLAARAAPAWWAGSAIACVLPLLFWMRGFAIDDAWISVRYARHLAAGLGYRFNAGGPMTDGVTPLPWPFLLALLARAPADVVLWRARAVGLAACFVALASWGAAVGRARAPFWSKAAALALLGACLPTAAHAMSGMETSVAMALATAASVASGPFRACALAGAVASLRPEAVVWAVALALGVGARRVVIPRVVVAAGPFVLCAIARQVVFGNPAPLALLAKPSDLAHGLPYAGAAALVSLAPVAACAPAVVLEPGRARALGLAGLAHFGAIAVAGGDGMPYARLAAPIVPSLLYAFVLAARRMWRPAAAARLAGAAALAVYVLIVAAPAGRHLRADYEALIARATPLLSSARRLAALDVGWPSSATEGDIIDLAGLTDPEIAALPGGHTSKRMEAAMLLARDPDVILLYRPSRVVEERLVSSERLQAKYETRAFLPKGDGGDGYVVLEKRRAVGD